MSRFLSPRGVVPRHATPRHATSPSAPPRMRVGGTAGAPPERLTNPPGGIDDTEGQTHGATNRGSSRPIFNCQTIRCTMAGSSPAMAAVASFHPFGPRTPNDPAPPASGHRETVQSPLRSGHDRSRGSLKHNRSTTALRMNKPRKRGFRGITRASVAAESHRRSGYRTISRRPGRRVLRHHCCRPLRARCRSARSRAGRRPVPVQPVPHRREGVRGVPRSPGRR